MKNGGQVNRDYVEQAYLPAAGALRRCALDDFAIAKDLAAWSSRPKQQWASLYISAPTVHRMGEAWRFLVPVYFGEVAADDVRVELYAEPVVPSLWRPSNHKWSRSSPGPWTDLSSLVKLLYAPGL